MLDPNAIDYLANQYYCIKLRGEAYYIPQNTSYVGPTNLPLRHPSETPPRLFSTRAKAERSLQLWLHGRGNRDAPEHHDLGIKQYADFEICPTVLGVKHSD